MKNSAHLLLLVTLSILSVSLAEAAPKLNAREYRPLSAKKVRIEVAGSAAETGKGALKTREGWSHFDAQAWEKAMDSFLSALELDPADHAAAEGLTMAVYRSGDRISAARLGEEFSEVMPWIRNMVAETVLADVKTELGQGGLTAAETLMGNLPYGAGAYDGVRALVEGAVAEAAAEAKMAVASVRKDA